MYLREPPQLTIYPPQNHREMIESLFRNLGASPEVIETGESDLRDPNENAMVSVATSGPSGTARIRVERFGSNVFQEVRFRLRELCLKRVEIIHLYLDLSNPQTAHYCEQFESLGFFFAGILPGTKVAMR